MLWLMLGTLVLGFGLVVLRGAPYLPTKRRQIEAAFSLLKLKPGAHIIDLGSGDGSVLKYAAEHGYRATGYELNPWLCVISTLRLWRWRKQAKVHYGDFWTKPLPECDGVFVFLIGHFMPKLVTKLEAELKPGTPVVSVAFELPGYKPERTKAGVHLYRIKARGKM